MENRQPMQKKTLLVIASLILVVGFLLGNYAIEVFIRSERYLSVLIEGGSISNERYTLPPISQFIVPNFEYKMVYGAIYLIGFIILLKFYYELKMNFADLNKGQHGTREFESVEQMKKQYKIIPADTKEYSGSGGVIIAGLQEGMKPYRLMIDESPVHTMVIGITRSGKGETFVVPMIDVLSRAKDKPSIVVNDPKGELAGASYDTLKARGYDVHVFNLMQQHMGMGFNPLQLVIDAWKKGNYALAEQYANSIGHSLYYDPNAKEAFWGNSASSLVKAIILALVEDSIAKGEEYKVNMYSVANFLSTLGSDTNEQTGENALDQFFQAREPNNPARLMYATSNFAGGNTRSSIFSIAMDKLQIFTSEPNARLTAYNSINLTDVGFGDKPVAIFMVTPDYDSSNHVLASIFVSQLYRVNAEKASMENGKMKRHVHFMLDEFGNMPTIEGMASMVTVGAGRGFRFHLIVQAYSQIKSAYGEEADTIVGNCSNQIYILTQDKSTAEQYSSLLGTKTITDVSRSGNLFSFDKSHSESTKERPLLMPDELMQLKEGESVVIRVNKRQDMKRNKIVPKPIYNKDATAHKFRYQYLAKDFDTSKSVVSLPITSSDYYNLNLNEIIFNALPKKEDQFIPMKKLMTTKEFKAVQAMMKRFTIKSKFEHTLPDFSEWSAIQLLSYIVYELRPSVEYFNKAINLSSFVDSETIEEWIFRLETILEEYGVLLEEPKRAPKRPTKIR